MAKIDWHEVELDYAHHGFSVAFTHNDYTHGLEEFASTWGGVWGNEALASAGIDYILNDSLGTSIIVDVDTGDGDTIKVATVLNTELEAYVKASA